MFRDYNIQTPPPPVMARLSSQSPRVNKFEIPAVFLWPKRIKDMHYQEISVDRWTRKTQKGFIVKHTAIQLSRKTDLHPSSLIIRSLSKQVWSIHFTSLPE